MIAKTFACYSIQNLSRSWERPPVRDWSTPGRGAAPGIVANHRDGAMLPGQLLLRRRSPKPVAAADLPAATPAGPGHAGRTRPRRPDPDTPAGPGHAGRTRIACVRGTIPGSRFVTSDQAPNVRSGLRSAERTETRRRL
jgi:hypothetical protein